MNFAVIGSGGREHAICYKLKQSPKIKKLICIPGNSGTQKIAKNIKIAKNCTCTFECASAINTVYDPKHWLSLI